jgi:hypothetical protein
LAVRGGEDRADVDDGQAVREQAARGQRRPHHAVRADLHLAEASTATHPAGVRYQTRCPTEPSDPDGVDEPGRRGRLQFEQASENLVASCRRHIVKRQQRLMHPT